MEEAKKKEVKKERMGEGKWSHSSIKPRAP